MIHCLALVNYNIWIRKRNSIISDGPWLMGTHTFLTPRTCCILPCFVTDNVLPTPLVMNELQADPDPLCILSLLGSAGLR